MLMAFLSDLATGLPTLRRGRSLEFTVIQGNIRNIFHVILTTATLAEMFLRGSRQNTYRTNKLIHILV